MPMTDQEVDEIIGGLLRYGVTLAATVVAAGGVWYSSNTARPSLDTMSFAASRNICATSRQSAVYPVFIAAA